MLIVTGYIHLDPAGLDLATGGSQRQARNVVRRSGLGQLALHLAANDLAGGRLVKLHVGHASDPTGRILLKISVARRFDKVLGPAGRWLLERLAGGLLEKAERLEAGATNYRSGGFEWNVGRRGPSFLGDQMRPAARAMS